MAEGGRTFSAQNALNTCDEHEHEDIDMYCKTCEKPVCTKCVKGEHHSHDWDSLNKVAKALRKDSRRKKMEMESVSKSIFIGMEDELNTLTVNEESQHELNRSELESTRKAIVATVNKMFSKMQSECDKDHKSKMKSMQKRKEEMKSKKERLEFLIRNIEVGAKDYTDQDLIELNEEIKQLIEAIQNIARLPGSWYHRPIYERGAYDESSLLQIVGAITVIESSSHVMLEREFVIADTPTNCIIPLSNNEAWMHSMQTSSIRLFNTRGHTEVAIDLKCLFYSFAVSDEGIVYCCNRDGKRVDHLNKTGSLKVAFSTAPLHPLFICLTRSGDFLITLVDEDNYNPGGSSRRLLRRVTSKGETLIDFEYDQISKKPLFCMPCSPIEHPDGRICVINNSENKDDEHEGTVYCFDSTGRVIFNYIDDDLNPLCICCAPKGNTLVSDCDNKRIHLLDSNGIFLCFLLTEEKFHENIYAIGLKGSTLWVASRDSGLVKVFKISET